MHLYVDVDVIVQSRKVFRDVAEVNVQNKAFFSIEKEKKERTKRKRGRKQKKRAFESTRTQLGFFDSLLRVPISIFSREPPFSVSELVVTIQDLAVLSRFTADKYVILIYDFLLSEFFVLTGKGRIYGNQSVSRRSMNDEWNKW